MKMKQKSQHPCHPLHKLTKQNHTPRLIKQTTFNNTSYTTVISTNSNTMPMSHCRYLSKQENVLHSNNHKNLTKIYNNKILPAFPPYICSSEDFPGTCFEPWPNSEQINATSSNLTYI